MPLLTADQREVCECFMIDRNEGDMLFLDTPGGTDKMLLLAKLQIKR